MAGEKICPTCSRTYAAAIVFCTEDGATLQSRDGDPLIGQVIAERYRIISHIGEGGMGQVYLAEHVHMRRRCAVKFLNSDLAGNEFALKRFMREAENASRIDHPNVVTMYDFGESTGGVYLAMEFVDGESLRKRVERQGVLPLDLIATVVRQTASALEAAHTLEIVHRDLKPDNIMLVERGDELRVKVVDFGIAKARDPKQKVTVTGAIVGTPDYMSPEQVTGDAMDGRSDQYALALVAVKMLTGKLPFANTTGVESLTSRLFSEPLPLRTLRADVAWPKQLQDVINRALSPKPADRFASVTEFARSFDRALSGMHGAVATTVPEIALTEIVPPTRMSERVAQVSASAAASRRPWLMAAALGVVVIGSGSLYAWSRAGSATSPPTAPAPVPYSLQVAAGDSSSAVAPDSTSQPPSAPPSTQPLAVPSGSARTPAAATTPPSAAPVAPVAPVAEKATPVRQDAAKPTPPAKDTARIAIAAAQPAVAPRDTQAPAPAPVPSATPAPATPAPTPGPAGAAKPALLTSSDVAAELARVRPMMTPESSRADVAAAVAALDKALPNITQRSDSIRVLYTRAQGLTLVEDLPGACRSLGRALALAAGTRLEETIARTSRDLSCP